MDGSDAPTASIETKAKPTKVHDIMAAAALQYGLTVKELKSPCRAHRLAHPRQLAMYLARKMTSASLPQIGHIFGGRDHTTVLFAERKITRLVAAGDAPTLDALTTLRATAANDNPAAAYRQRELATRYADEERLASMEAEAAIQHAERMRKLRRIKQLAESGFIPSDRPLTGAA